MNLVILYDNNLYSGRLRTGWGFSCLIRLPQRAILFDSGGDSFTLLYNMRELQIDPKEVGFVVLSHLHGDHVGGLAGFLGQNSDITIYLPNSSSRGFKAKIESLGARVEGVRGAGRLFDHVYTTGELDGIKEQSLIVSTAKGLVVVTGCAHPGIVKIVRTSKEIVKDRVHLVLGGFHSPPASAVPEFKELGVEKVSPCHCSGEGICALFKERYTEDYIECGVGRRISIS